MSRFFFNKNSQQKVKMNRFTVLESRNRLSTRTAAEWGWILIGREVAGTRVGIHETWDQGKREHYKAPVWKQLGMRTL